jgi:hypothetical protein
MTTTRTPLEPVQPLVVASRGLNIRQRTPDQIGFVVPDLEHAVRSFASDLGIGPWLIWDYSPPVLAWRTYRGGAGTWSMKAAFVGSKPEIELIEPLEGPSTYHDFLASNPNGGVHHLAYVVDSFQETAATLAELGVELIQAGGGHGLDGDGAFGYFDSRRRLGFILEAIQPPARRRAAALVYVDGQFVPNDAGLTRP